MRTADEIRRAVAEIKEISTLPQVMQRIMEIVVDEKSSARELAREVAHDQALTSKVLKIVNSALYGFYRRVSTVDEAVVILGYNEVRSIAMTISVFELFSAGGDAALFDRIKLWEHSVAAGTMADIVRRECCPADEAAFVAGLLHDIGKVVLDEYFAPEWRKVVELSRAENLPLVESERRLLGITHSEIGLILSDCWNLPEPVGQAILNHHQEPRLASSTSLDCIVYVANVLVKQRQIGFSGDASVWPLEHETKQIIGLHDYLMPRIETQMKKRISTVAALSGYFS